jgi:hypothetical protein
MSARPCLNSSTQRHKTLKIVHERVPNKKPFPIYGKYAGGRLLLGTVEHIVPAEGANKYRFRPVHSPHQPVDFTQLAGLKHHLTDPKAV